MKKNSEKFWLYWDSYGIFGIVAFALIVFGLLNPTIISPSNLITVLSRSAITAIAACGMTFAICSGGFDLSAGATLSLSTCIFASVTAKTGMAQAIIAVILIAALIGVINGVVITKLKIQTFVATFAIGMIIRGVTLLYTNGLKMLLDRNLNPEAKFFSQNFTIGSVQIQLVPVVLTIIAFSLGLFFYKYTKFGVYCRSIGSNEPASRTSGINVDMVMIIVFILTAVTASISGIIRASQLMQGHSTLGEGFELEAITATILGGTSLAGGKGNILGTFMGALMLTLMRSGLNILGLGDTYQRLAIGLILLLSLSINGIREILKGTDV
jgi:ribose/xylose/arabinose/galactoside ABC-type transport system permease subunit